MKKFILSIIVIASFGFYVISQNTGNSSGNLLSLSNTNSSDTNTNTIPTNVVPNPSDTNNPYSNPQDNTNQQINTSITSTQPTKIIVPTPTSTPIVKKTGLYNDGTYIGNPAFAYNDNVQVKVIISNSKISDIQFVQYPASGRSGRISSFSLPTLKQEAIKAQSANINAVSGASYTSPAFIQSLTSALDQAKV